MIEVEVEVEVEFDDNEIFDALNNLLSSGNVNDALLEIGEYLTESTKQRFASKQSPRRLSENSDRSEGEETGFSIIRGE